MTRIHVSLRTADLEATTAFYTQLFGEAPDKVRPGYRRFAPAGVPVLLALMEGEPGVDHFGIRVDDVGAASAAWARLQESGVALDPSEGVVCCHATKSEAWLADPDGRGWEVYAVTDENPEEVPTSSTCCA